MKRKSFFLSTFFILLACLSLNASGLASFRVDINKYGRAVTEGNNTNFLPWTYVNNTIVRDTLINPLFPTDTVVVQLRGLTLANQDTIVWNNYYKAGITSPTVTNDAKLTLDGGFSRIIEMTIHGLPAGPNTLLTYHNNVDAATAWVYNPIRILVNGQVVVDSLKPTVRELIMSNVPVSYLTFMVEEGKDVVVRFEPIPVQPNGTLKPFNCVPLNGFELNTPNVLHQAYNAYPNDRDKHADGDTGAMKLRWNKAATANTHNLFIGTDSLEVTNATITSAAFIGTKLKNDTTYTLNVDNLTNYFWRVDEITADGVVTRGNTWFFKVRHLAFRGAEGYGRFAAGGRGGKVVHVTNLNDDGPGSFRAAVTGNNGEARTVVFDVSGVIRLTSRLVMGINITVAGQTAPGKGICIRTSPVGVNNDCICRFVRLRLGGGKTYDGMGMAGVEQGIIDHCSISWTIDEAFSSRNSKNITLQRTFISEALNVAGHENYPAGTAHGYAGTIGGNTGSYHHNLMAHNEGRNFSMGSAIDGSGVYNSKIDMFNNVVYNFGGRANDGQCHELNFVNNFYKKGPATRINFTCKMDFENYGTGTLQACYSGNILANSDNSYICNGTDTTCGRLYTLTNGNPEPTFPVFVTKPFFPSYATIESAKDAYKSVLSDVGCNMPVMDNHDKRVLTETLNGTYTYVGSYTGKKGLIDNEADAGGYEDYGSETRPAGFDTDGDGLPDWWETLHNTNPSSPANDFSDANADPDKDGYTQLEDYLEWMAVPHYYLTNNNPTVDIELTGLSAGYTQGTTYSTDNSVSGINTVINDGKMMVTTASASPGIYYLKLKIRDSENSSIVRPIGICVGTSEPAAVNDVSKNTSSANVYPAVFTNELKISIRNATSTAVIVRLKDITGRILMQQKYAISQDTNNLSLSCPDAIIPQLYIVEVADAHSGEKITYQKVVKK